VQLQLLRVGYCNDTRCVRGVKLGGFRAGAEPTTQARASGQAVRQERANAFACAVGPVIERIRENGTIAQASIAKELIKQGVPSARGGHWTGTQVDHVRDRFLALKIELRTQNRAAAQEYVI
jgi:hypothetical protein